jgi:hypothetical protein
MPRGVLHVAGIVATWLVDSDREVTMSVQPDHELEILEYDQTVPPRPEEVIADAGRAGESEAVPAPDEGEPAGPE